MNRARTAILYRRVAELFVALAVELDADEDRAADPLARLEAFLILYKRGHVDERPDWTRSYVYFVEAPVVHRIKIGVTRGLYDRFNALKTNSPTPLVMLGHIVGDVTDEGSLHARFGRHRANGEWFDDAIKPEILALLAEWAPHLAELEKVYPR